MSGPLGSQQWMYASGGFYDHTIDNSLRFNDDDSAYLSRTPASAGNRKTWTWSGWVKRGGAFTLNQSLFSSATNYDDLRFSTNGELLFVGGTSGCTFATTSEYRDPSAWMNIVFAFDTTQATSSDRVKIYVNGEQVTSFVTAIYPALNRELDFNNTVAHAIGRRESTDNLYADLYLADVNFIDGQALDPTSFGETKSGIWIPKDTSGLTFGTNGFRLQFGDSAAIGDDTSGNTNDWTVNNLVASDVVLDAPTNNWCVWNPLRQGANFTTSEGNLKAVTNATVAQTIAGTFGMSSGKWYWEVKNEGGSLSYTGIVDSTHDMSIYIGFSTTGSGYAYNTSGNKVGPTSGTSVAYGATYTAGDIIGVALDMDAGTLEFYKNGVSQGTAFTGITGTWFAATSGNGVAGKGGFANFGQDSTFAGATTAGGNADENGYGDFKYAVPSGFLSLCSANLPTGAIDTLNDETPEDYFNTVLWTGDATNPRTLTGVGFEPSFSWLKSRSQAFSHRLYDQIRGGGKVLFSDTTGVESGPDNGGDITAWTADGFTTSGALNNNNLNGSGYTYAAWNWKAGGSGVSNTDGSITSTVSVSQTGDGTKWFSVVGFTTQAGGYTVGHGLGQKPSLIITKNRDTAGGVWYTFTDIIDGSVDYLALNQTSAKLNDPFGLANPTSSVFSLDDDYIFGSGDCIAYCFANAEGLCKVGSYTGNGSADGTFVYTGHRPSFLLIKSATYSSTNWLLFDNRREIDNPVELELNANNNNVENNNGRDIDFVSNGFKIRSGANNNLNTSGGSYIFLSISEQPFKFANAR